MILKILSVPHEEVLCTNYVKPVSGQYLKFVISEFEILVCFVVSVIPLQRTGGILN